MMALKKKKQKEHHALAIGFDTKKVNLLIHLFKSRILKISLVSFIKYIFHSN